MAAPAPVILQNIADPWMWAAFIGFVIAMLALDLWVFGGNKAHKVSPKEAGLWSLAWAAMALGFAGLLWWHLNATFGAAIAEAKTLEFLTGYIIEKSLSVDNVFVFLMIFSAFQVPPQFQRRVLIYGVLGAIILRAIMILAGAWVVKEFHWVLYIFGAFLLFTGIRMLVANEKEPDIQANPVLLFIRRHLRITPQLHAEHFIVRQNGLLYFTPLFLVLIMIELSDVIFAVDSIPAIFAITTDPFIVFTSNIFAILGLRALYFLLADMADRFHLLKFGLAMVLTFIGSKMLIMPWYHVPTAASLMVVVCLIGGSVVASLWASKKT